MRGRTLIVAAGVLMALTGIAAAQLSPGDGPGRESGGGPRGGPTPAQTPAAPDDGKDPNVRRDVSHYNLERGKPAIDGYDPVAYFPEGGGKAMRGKAEFAYTYRGVTYRFASAANRDRFKADPRKYEPAYGGWCAYAMADGEKVEIDPRSFKITDGRLFLFYKDLITDTRSRWSKDEPNLRGKADGAWKKTAGEEPPKQTDAEATPPAGGAQGR
jgi:YHS domain-containing protein